MMSLLLTCYLFFSGFVIYVIKAEDVASLRFPISIPTLVDSGRNVQRIHYTESVRSSTRCGGWMRRRRCTQYRTVHKSRLQCFWGYQNFGSTRWSCDFAICASKISYGNNGACTQHYANDFIQTKLDTSTRIRDSGGTCSSPETCTNCNTGFYPSGPTCIICPPIQKCLYRDCTNPGDNICKLCDGEVKAKPFWRAYTRFNDNYRTCQKACSWRKDSTRCFPGKCKDETMCECSQGFAGHHCEKITEKPSVLYNEVELTDGSIVLRNPNDPNADYSPHESTVWTKEIQMSLVEVRLDAKYVMTEKLSNEPDVTGEHHYVTDWDHGITKASVSLTHTRGNVTNDIGSHFIASGDILNELKMTRCFYFWNGRFKSECISFTNFGGFHHADTLEIELSVTNGGYVEVVDREDGDKRAKHDLIGQTENRIFWFHFDTENPYQRCVESKDVTCTQPFSTPDVAMNGTITLSWDDWMDDLSQVQYYSYQIYDMSINGNKLTENTLLIENDLHLNMSKTSVDLSSFARGMFSVIFTVHDNAGNHKSARQLTLFDDISSVSMLSNGVSRVTTASAVTGYKWVVEDTHIIDFEFKDRFINEFHHRNKLLNQTTPYPDVDQQYDDKYGVRMTSYIHNVHGIVNFKVSYELNSAEDTIKETRTLISIRNVYDQSETLNISWSDADRLVLVVRATDVVGNYDEETVTVYRDATSPVIENLWLTRGNRNNIYIHNVDDFTKMTIEWDTYDYHSGIHSLEWKMYDNFTHSAIEHGQEVLTSQGNSHNITNCQSKYGGNLLDCYCTPFWGCFHKHFVVKPEVRKEAGLHLGKDIGIHDYDYYIEVKVTNIANLTTIQTIKITIDTSPPHTGVVHDGVSGTPEIDYQQSKTLHAHWEGFFDRESGVKFYLYTFSMSCQNSTVMDLKSHGSNVFETTARFASQIIERHGLYFVTVVAFNQALEPSSPVCSDGVTVDTSTPSVKEVIIQHARVRGGLMTDTNRTTYWLLGSDRTRRLLDNVTSECISKATVQTDVELYPLHRDEKGQMSLIDGHLFCSNTSGSPGVVVNIVTKPAMINVSWIQDGSPGDIYDYEVGISKSVGGGSAPDILGYVSSRQHSHVILKHTDLPSGTEFYIVIKTISKANVEGIQMIGPCLMDTTAPTYIGEITTQFSDNHLVASWSVGDFIDSEDNYNFDFHFSIGTEESSTSIQRYQTLRGGGPCHLTIPPTCTAVLISELEWELHGHRTYYFTIRVVNTAGLATVVRSLPYVHDVQLASIGIISDILVDNQDSASNYLQMTGIEDIDFQTEKTRVRARWSGFVHPHLDVMFRVSIGSSGGNADILPVTDVRNQTSYLASHLNLSYFNTYYFNVEAVTIAGIVNASSDGVTIVKKNSILNDVEVYDGKSCNKSELISPSLPETKDIDFQAALNSIQAHWTIPGQLQLIITNIFWSYESKTAIGNQWISETDFENVRGSSEVERHDSFLLPGQTYRSVLRFCSQDICYAPLLTNGFTVLSSPPRAGDISVSHVDQTPAEQEKLLVRMSRFFDPDVADDIRYDVIDKYEWAITDNSENGKIFMDWKVLNVSQVIILDTNMKFEITLHGKMDFSRCKRFSVRGYNKAMLSTVVSTDIKSCSASDPILIKPNIVIDVMGELDESENTGKPISLPQNHHWTRADVDYIPYSNFISAVWPSLRHREYRYAVIQAETDYANSHYVPKYKQSLSDPCSHSRVVKGTCGETDKEFVNIRLEGGTLIHGQRYLVCIYAEQKEVQHETWVENLPEISTCSDGVVIDLTPPMAGRVWIGQLQSQIYQQSTSHMLVNWEGFSDVEEFKTNAHASGIEYYLLNIGTSPGSSDIVHARNVGIIDHVVLHNLKLMNGHTYYASLTAVDFVNHLTVVTSSPVIVDTTPPLKTDQPITLNGRHIISNRQVRACWKNVFFDPESSVSHYEWSIGSHPGRDDMKHYTMVLDQCAVSDANNQLDLHEGHAYFVNVKAINGAGLLTLATSWAIVAEFSPPIKGHVYDGKRGSYLTKSRDQDFQSDTKYIAAYWEGFRDPHSTIKEYWIRVGTCRECDDVLHSQPVGISQDFVLPSRQLETGKRYHTTVTACNTADMCSSVTTDGVILDDSPPLPGRVQDGLEELDCHYQAERTYISAKWYGFSDPQSGLDRYEWWAGTSKGGNDVISLRELHLQESAVAFNITPLPINEKIYITVRVYNKAGLFSETISNGFTVDTSPPVVTAPTLSQDLGSLRPNTIVFRDCFKVTWTASDGDSYIEKQYLSLKAHRGGEFKINSFHISGIVRDFLLTDLDLHDGVNYYVTLIACNGAGLCTQAESAAVFVDSSPPTRGMFAIETNHAAELKRVVSGYMRWTRFAVYLTWVGFSDLHSNIDCYMITIGTSYMSKDLLRGNKDTVKIDHSTTGNRSDEGQIQNATIQTENLEELTDGIYIALWAVNNVGLNSEIINSKFNLIRGGGLELVRRCSAFSCAGHCVCAPQDQACDPTGTCKDKTGDPSLSVVGVKDIIDFRESTTKMDSNFTPSAAVVAGNWFLLQYRTLNPIWYEYSFGLHTLSAPDKGFYSNSDRIWYDAAQNNVKIVTLQTGRKIQKHVKYSFFIRAWYTTDTYAIFKSDSITLDRLEDGRTLNTVIEYSKDGLTSKDRDYIKYYPFVVSWNYRDLYTQNMIDGVRLYLSSTPKGHNIYYREIKTPINSFTFMRFYFETHTKIFSNVIAYSNTGAHDVASSDGFIIDDSPPRTGVVYDGIGHKDVDFQSSTHSMSACWQGFVDLDSGIASYFWCVGRTKSIEECDVLDWQNVGLRTTTTSLVNLSSGNIFYNKIFAIDRVGHKSLKCISDGVKVDVTPPEPVQMIHADINVIENPSFEFVNDKQLSLEQVSATDFCLLDNHFRPPKWTATKCSCVSVVSANTAQAKSGVNLLYIRGTIKQDVTGLQSGGLYRVTFSTSHLPMNDSALANKEGCMTFEDKTFIFLMYTKGARYDHDVVETTQSISWHTHTYYIQVSSPTETFTVGSVDKTAIMLLDDVKVQRVLGNATVQNSVHVNITLVHEWTSIHAAWRFLENESSIVDYQWAIGHVKGGTTIQQLKSTGLETFSYNNDVTLTHGSAVHVTVLASNSAGLIGIAYASPLRVDLTPPDIMEVNDGHDFDIDYWDKDEVLVSWRVEDRESSIRLCEWAIGFQPYGKTIQEFTMLAENTFKAENKSVGYDRVAGKVIYSTIRCENNAGLHSIKSSNGVTIVKKGLDATHADLQNAPLSKTEYIPRPGFQSVSNQLRLKWTGFSDVILIDEFIFSLEGSGTNNLQRRIMSTHQPYTYLLLKGFKSLNGNLEVSVQAINELLSIRCLIGINMTVSQDKPKYHKSKDLDITLENNKETLVISWHDVFYAEGYLYYEVSAGTVLGGGDIAQWVETKNKHLTLGLPSWLQKLGNTDVFVIIRAVSMFGMNVVKVGEFFISS